MRRLAVIALAVVVTACGGGDGRQAAPACPVERTLVAEATGLVLGGRVEPVAIGTDVQCSFRAADGITGVSVVTWTGGAEAFMGSFAGDDDVEPVELAFADEAVWLGATTTLYATSGDRGVTVQVTDLTDVVDDPLRAATELAAAALA